MTAVRSSSSVSFSISAFSIFRTFDIRDFCQRVSSRRCGSEARSAFLRTLFFLLSPDDNFVEHFLAADVVAEDTPGRRSSIAKYRCISLGTAPHLARRLMAFSRHFTRSNGRSTSTTPTQELIAFEPATRAWRLLPDAAPTRIHPSLRNSQRGRVTYRECAFGRIILTHKVASRHLCSIFSRTSAIWRDSCSIRSSRLAIRRSSAAASIGIA